MKEASDVARVAKREDGPLPSGLPVRPLEATLEPLRGIRIIEVTTNASGPLATGILADQGADVIRLETIGAGDPSRHVGGVRGGVTGYTAYLNRNKRSMAVDLKNPDLREPLRRLIATADVFVQNSRPGALDRHGYGYDALHAEHPDLIYVSISGFGATGPAAHQRVYDPVIQSVAGFAAAQTTNGVPDLVKTVASDKVAALTAAQAISAALFARERGLCRGQHVELSMLDASLAFLWPEVYWNHSFVGSEGFQAKPLIADFYRLLPTRDGYITMIVVGDDEFKGACDSLELPGLLAEPKFRTLSDRFANYGELFAEFAKGTVRLTTAEVVARMDKAGVPCAKVNTLDEVIVDPRVTARDSVIEYDHPQAGRLRQARPAAIFGGEPNGVRLPSPGLGQHTVEVLRSVGCQDAEIEALRAAGAIN
jgi:crotonobetainyl-CoA:carnitine CoA-transferase CaiB-like acyl-CoA transferase